MPSYPITQEVHNARERFPEINSAVEIQCSGRSELEIVRLLGITQCLDQLIWLNKYLPRSGDIGKQVVKQTDPFQFEQALRELFLLVHLQKVPAAQACAASAGSPSESYYDIDLTCGELSVRIEVYCPVDFFGFQLLKRHISQIFRYLDAKVGFVIELRLETSEDMDWFYPYGVGDEQTVRPWLACLEGKAAEWVRNSPACNPFELAGPTEKVRLSATLLEVCDNPEDRCIRFLLPTRSTDTKLFFETGNPEDTAKSEWGKKLLSKMRRRQCGKPTPAYIRVLVVDFSLADTGSPDFICQPRIAKRLTETLDLLVGEVGQPLPYDAVLPARLSGKCCFGEVIALDCRRTEEIQQIVKAAWLDRPCVLPRIDQTQDILNMLNEVP